MLDRRRHTRYLVLALCMSTALLLVLYHVTFSGPDDPVTLTQILTQEQLLALGVEQEDSTSAQYDTHEEQEVNGLALALVDRNDTDLLTDIEEEVSIASSHGNETRKSVTLGDNGEESRSSALNDSLTPLGEDIEPRPKYLKGYKSRCWLEKIKDVEDLYYGNPFALGRRGLTYFTELRDYYSKLIETHGASRQIHCLPYAMVVGFPKSGTTELFDKLLLHPDILGSYMKEPHFWTRHRYPEKAFQSRRGPVPSSFRNYVEIFDQPAIAITQSTNAQGNHGKIIIEGSASTIWDNRLWPRLRGNENLTEPELVNAHDVRRLMPDTKFLVITRNPTDRLYSGYTYFKTGNLGPEEFHDYAVDAVASMTKCLEEDPERACAYPSPDLVRKHNITSRIYVGMYALYIKEWFKLFPRNQFLFLRLEEYSQDRLHYLQQITHFLEIDQYPPSTLQKLEYIGKSNSQPKKKPMLAKTRKLLNDFYRPFNEKLSNLLNDKGYMWDL